MPIIYSFDRDDWTYPAYEFERMTGAKHVAKWYRMPEGKPILDVATDMITHIHAIEEDAEYKTVARGYIAQLEALNPELENLRYDDDDGQDLANVLLGVLSSINLDDMQFFIDTTGKKGAERDPAMSDMGAGGIYRLMLNNIYTELHGLHGGWVLSPQTFDRLREHFNIAAELTISDADVERRYLQERQAEMAEVKETYERSKQRYEVLKSALQL
jgi:hypothetical protein